MNEAALRSMRLELSVERWPRAKPARITGYVIDVSEVIVVSLSAEGVTGKGEAMGAYYKGDSGASMTAEIEALRRQIEAGVDHIGIAQLLPAGGARNALDCALWDLEAKLTGVPAWQRACLEAPNPLLTTLTCHADEPAAMAAQALGHTGARAIKLKLTGEAIDADRVLAVRDALPDVWLAVDANQGFSRRFFESLMPTLVANRVALVEQPFRVGDEQLLGGIDSPIPIAADESVQTLSDVEGMAGFFDVINIKLDKCGGLTEGLAMARRARELGMDVMVGNMGGTSLSTAPAYLLGQLCDVVDLDGPTFLRSDRAVHVEYLDGYLHCPPHLWGQAEA